MNKIIQRVQAEFAQDFTKAGLKTLIILWALFIIALALLIDEPWVLAGILAYEVLP
jgi:hypothetical protein